ncbi:sporulation integral membrane protein YlbJ [Lachnospiraceae bacterium]|nr:sporulation integral membrane protein YlbJ [Lachnospiraceae bacterium]
MLLKTLAYLLLIIIILSRPDAAFQYAYEGLYQWATKMVPTLFPFMMISSIMVYSGADLELGRMLNRILKYIYRYSSYGLYAIFMGFFCGFPMGAKVVSELYETKRLSKTEAETLLAFCNNIGPAYFVGIIIPILHTCGHHQILPFLFGMYGIPALYGIFIQYITAASKNKNPKKQNIDIYFVNSNQNSLETSKISLITALKKSCIDNTQSLIVLGGYITFANAFRILLDFVPLSLNSKNVLSSFLEIIGGVQAIYITSIPPAQKIFWIMTVLCFGGISCILQTSSFLEKTGLSIVSYLKHKIILTIISASYYFILTNFI